MTPLNRNAVEGCAVHPGSFSASFISLSCFLRGLPFFVYARPKTPLRTMCMMAFDTYYACRNSKRLSAHSLKVLATLLDLGACANTFFDVKNPSPKEYRATLELLEDAGIRSAVDEYLTRLGELERERPAPGGGYQQHLKVRSYREAVVRLSLGVVATTAFGKQSVVEGVQATRSDRVLAILFRIVMQCQIIDDVLDYSKDAAAGLPSFLTAPASLSEAFELAYEAAGEYSRLGDMPLSGDGFPFRVGLFGVSICAKLVVGLGGWRRRLLCVSSPQTSLLGKTAGGSLEP